MSASAPRRREGRSGRPRPPYWPIPRSRHSNTWTWRSPRAPRSAAEAALNPYLRVAEKYKPSTRARESAFLHDSVLLLSACVDTESAMPYLRVTLEAANERKRSTCPLASTGQTTGEEGASYGRILVSRGHQGRRRRRWWHQRG